MGFLNIFKFYLGAFGKILLFGYLILMLIDIKAQGNALRFSFIQSLSFWRHLTNYFPIKLIKTVDLQPDKNYLFAAFPHGTFAYGFFLNFGAKATNFRDLFPGIDLKFCTLPFFFYVPIVREIFLSIDLIPVSYKSIKNFLSKSSSNSVAIAVGGARESLYSTPGVYKFFIKNRKGFVKIALETGSSLVPVISFGEVDAFNLPPVNEENFSGSLKYWPKLFLQCGFRVGFLHLLPNRSPIITVVGAPIHVEKICNPSQTEIDELHEKFMKEIEKLFNDQKEKFATSDAQLIMK